MTGDDVVRLVDSATRAGAWPLRRERRRALLVFGALVAIVAPMRGLGLPTGMKAAARADILWLTAFEVGLSGWMALFLVLFRLRITAESPVYWIGSKPGGSLPFHGEAANVWLIRKGSRKRCALSDRPAILVGTRRFSRATCSASRRAPPTCRARSR